MPFLKDAIFNIQMFATIFRDNIARRVKNFGAQYTAFGIFGVLNYPTFYLIWVFYNNKSYESLALRLTATILCIVLLLKNIWPNKLKPWLPVYWYFTLLFCLPFFFFFMLFKNNGANVWLMSSNTTLFWLLLMVDWTSYIFIFFIGFLTAILAYILTTSHFTFNLDNWWGIAAQFIASFIVVAFFVRKKREFDEQKLQAMQTVSATVAHELRTPLATLNISADTIKKIFPDFLEAYQLAKQANLPVREFRQQYLDSLKESLITFGSEINAAFTFIDMMLMKVNPSSHTSTTEIFSIADCVNETLLRYPFDLDQKQLVEWELSNNQDFSVRGEKLLIIHVLFNLMKNALYYVAVAGKRNQTGCIKIWLESDSAFNILYFKDIGTGIAKEALPHIFDRFYTNTYHGTGVGLSFCKMVMESLEGQISCESAAGHYTLFKLSFPKY